VNLAQATPLGRLQIGGLATYLARRDKEPFEGSVPVHDAGAFDVDSRQAFPHWRALGHVTWQRGPWQISYALQYIGGLTESVEPDETVFQHRISSVTYHDIEGAYELAGRGRLRLGVTNLTDRDPPFVNANSQANTDAATYRLLGRTYFADIRFRLN
jgi:outer membrane receptor protein involved in Fe transport